MKKQISIGLVDDHKIILDGLIALFENEADYQIAFATTKPGQVLEQISNYPIDVLITDVMMPAISGNELSVMVRKQFPQIKILALSMNGQGLIIDQMINSSDINGYVLK